jgi:hypothetical protein
MQQEKKGKISPPDAGAYSPAKDGPGHQITKPIGRGKAKRRPRLGKSTHAGSRKSRSSSTRKNTRSKATAQRTQEQSRRNLARKPDSPNGPAKQKRPERQMRQSEFPVSRRGMNQESDHNKHNHPPKGARKH